MRRGGSVDLILGATVLIWALNVTVTRYVLTHGFKPLAYGVTRYAAAALLAVGFGGVALVALGSGGGLSSDLGGDLLAIALAATWACYSVTIAPLMRRYSPYRISAVALCVICVPFLGISAQQLGDQDYGSLSALTWACLAYAIVGPLFLTNLL
jgi:drug/metabolite transporter (DMT)-like permease